MGVLAIDFQQRPPQTTGSNKKHSHTYLMRYLNFAFGGASFKGGLRKVSRADLYGITKTEVVDEDGLKCRSVTLADDGQTIIEETSLAYLSEEGRWLQKSDLKRVDMEGNPLEVHRSSFSAPIDLGEVASNDEFLNHTIDTVYELVIDELPMVLQAALDEGQIFTFPFTYSGGTTLKTAFLLQSEEGMTAWMVIGEKSSLEYFGLAQRAVAKGDGEEEELDDILDFGAL